MASIEILTASEAARLLRAPSAVAPTGIRNRALMAVLYRGGLRCAEALDLKPSDIDPVTGTVRILDGKGHKARTVALDDGALAVVQRWVDRRSALGIRRGPLFCTLNGGKLDPGYVRAMIKRYGRRAGIEKRVHPHGMRHANAAEMAAEGIPVNVIQDHLGHESLATTGIYLKHIAPAQVIAMGRARTWNLEDK
jgi:site-specific recombinase XerD